METILLYSIHIHSTMSPLIIIIIIMVAILCLLLTALQYTLLHRIRPLPPLPPGPRPLPLIGNLHMLGPLPHRALQSQSKIHGPIMSLRLGHVPTVVISSPAAAHQVLKLHDTAFASRPKTKASEHLCYGTKGVAFTEYGPYWRSLRRLCSSQLLKAARIESYAGLRRREVGSTVARLRESGERKEVAELSERVSELVEEVSFRTLVGDEIDIVDFKGLAKEGTRLIGTFNLADYVPFLAPFDLQGLTREMVKLSKEIDKILEKIIDQVQQSSEEKKQAGKDDQPMSFIEVLLSLVNQPMPNNNPHDDHQDQDHFTIQITNVKAVLVDMIAASFDTTVNVIEWTLSELLRNPEIMERVRQELNDVVGMERLVEEADLSKLTYLDMVIMESFRLHPVAPFLVPRESMEDVELCGYFIPKKTRIIINTWAIGRDPNVWSDNAEEFIPERFEGSEIAFRGNDFGFLPFRSGRRGCPGMQLGLTMVRLVVAQLVHCFSWELPNGMSPFDLDMTEKFGLNITRANHLRALPTYRLKT